MSREQSDGDDSVVETEGGPVDDGTAETEVNFRLPRGSDPGPEGVPKDIPFITGAFGAEADTPDPGEPRRLGPLAGRNRNGPRLTCRPPTYSAPSRPLPGAGTQPVTDRFTYELLTLPTSGQGRLPPWTRTQPVPDRFMNDPPSQTGCLITIDCRRGQKCMTHIGHRRPT